MSDKDMQHSIVAAVIQMAKELGRTPSRDHFVSNSPYTKHQIDKYFGGWTALIHSQGFDPPRKKKPSKEEKKFDRQIDKYEFHKSLLNKFESELKPYTNKFRDVNKNYLTILAASDFHDEYVCPFSLSVFLDVARRVQPDIICLDGDMFDFPEVSSYDKDPSKILGMQRQIDFGVNNFFKPLRELCPKAQIDFVLGNHELRLFKWLVRNPALASLRCLKFNELLELDKYQINLIARKTFLTETRKSKAQNYYIYAERLCAYHGFSCSVTHAHKNLAQFGTWGFSGHVHEYQVASKKDLNGEKQWTSLGTMARLELAEEYIDGIANWNKGFGLYHISPSDILPEYVRIGSDSALYSGKVYYKSP